MYKVNADSVMVGFTYMHGEMTATIDPANIHLNIDMRKRNGKTG